MKLSRSFYNRSADQVAEALLGTILVVSNQQRALKAKIVETEAYVGSHDLACHASKGKTPRTQVMFGPPGYAYVYFIYGMYYMLNFVTSSVNDSQAVLIRATEPLDGWKADLSGPGKLTRAFHIDKTFNGLDLCGDKIFVEKGKPPKDIVRTKRIGVHYAGPWKNKLLRFYDAESSAVSFKM